MIIVMIKNPFLSFFKQSCIFWNLGHLLLPPAICGKVMFSQVSVILFTGGECVAGGWHAWPEGGVHGKVGACMAKGGMHGEGGRVW